VPVQKSGSHPFCDNAGVSRCPRPGPQPEQDSKNAGWHEMGGALQMTS